jgi:hypothetical protein
MSKRKEISRRDFASKSLMAAAGVAAGKTALGATRTGTGPVVSNRVIGANDRVVVASIGIRGQGDALKRGFARLPNVEIKTLCDVDENLFASRVQDPALKDVATFKPGYQRDLRRVFDDKDVDAVMIATPNHWHALATIWALQAGKHVYVEKPASHTVWEGRKMVEAARKYNKIVQVGTMNRSRPVVMEAIKYLQDGGIGEIYMARGLCFKPRPSIGKYPDGPMAPGEQYKLNVESRDYEPAYDAAYLAKVSYDIWLGPAPERPFNRNHFHYNWHWHWPYGNGDTGNQGPHQFDVPAGASARTSTLSHPFGRRLLRRGVLAGDAQPPHHDVRVRRRQGPRVRDPRRLHQRRGLAADRQPVLRHQGLGVDRRRRAEVAVLPGAQGREGAGGRRAQGEVRQRERSPGPDQHRIPPLPELQRRHPRQRPQGPHVRDHGGPHVVDAAAPPTSRRPGATLRRARRRRSSGTEANKLPTREYRKPYVIPDKV